MTKPTLVVINAEALKAEIGDRVDRLLKPGDAGLNEYEIILTTRDTGPTIDLLYRAVGGASGRLPFSLCEYDGEGLPAGVAADLGGIPYHVGNAGEYADHFDFERVATLRDGKEALARIAMENQGLSQSKDGRNPAD